MQSLVKMVSHKTLGGMIASVYVLQVYVRRDEVTWYWQIQLTHLCTMSRMHALPSLKALTTSIRARATR